MEESFGRLLRSYRVRLSLTQEVLASRCKVSPATIAALEQGRRTAPRLSTVALIAAALELSPGEVGTLARAASRARDNDHSPAPALAPVPVPVPVPASPAGRLPAPITSLIGRQAEVAAVAQLVLTERLVTLTGLGGVGKTRLAIAVATSMLEKFSGGACWVELGSVQDPAGVRAAVLRALRPGGQACGAAGGQPLPALPEDPVLVVIDSCEHVLDAAAAVIGELLSQPSVTVLTTSREPLAIPGEIRWPVPALTVPPRDGAVSVAELMEVASVALFVERARRASRGFALTGDNAAAVARICRRLDGLPLALELAAAQAGWLSPQRLAAELEQRSLPAAVAARGVAGRHRTLRACIEWSYRLLNAEEQAAFGCLAAFAGSFTPAAFAAATDPAADPRRGSRILASLIEKSLVLTGSLPGQYQVPETIRAFAAERPAAA
jgi:predicted ATPase/transcriptional regulator with XRE-family HTH domain